MPAISSPVSSLTWGTSVANPNIDVYFVPDGDPLNEFISEGASDYEIAQFEAAYGIIASIANLTFTVTDDPNAYFQIAIDDDELLGSLDGKMAPPGEDDEGTAIFDGQDIVRGPGGPLDPGGYDFMVVLHETLHGLGLAHPHDDGGGSPIMDGVDDAFGDYGDFNLNQGVFTAMTYNNGYFTGTPGSEPDGSLLYGYESTPMALDIAVLQSLYGANMTTATGDDTYSLVDTNGPGTGWVSIWDAGGTDEIRYDGALDATIDLRDATLLYEEGGGGFISSVTGIAGGFTIANGVVIENATSGAGDDGLTGNTAANTLAAGAGEDTVAGGDGDDTITGGAGDDTLSGGEDADTFKSSAGDGDDEITDFDPAADILMIDGVDTGGAADIGAFLDANATVDGDDLVLSLGAGHSIRLVGVVDPLDPDGSIAAVGAAIAGLTFGDTPGEVPTDGDDNLVGTPGRDGIDALGGDDTVLGGDGNDTLSGGTGDDLVDGGGGSNRVFGNEGDDTLIGGEGRDVIRGGEGDDMLFGGDGADRLQGGKQNDTLEGGAGADRLDGQQGDDLMDGGDGNDQLNGAKGDDTLIGGEGNDVLRGVDGDDSLDGGTGEDRLLGGKGDDTLEGGDDNDRLQGQQGDDYLDGGEGDDQLEGANGEDTLVGGAGDDTLSGGKDADVFVSDVGSGADIITDFAFGEDALDLLDVEFGDEPEQVSRADFLAENASIDGNDLFLDLGDGRSIRILDVVDEDEIGDEAEDYVDLFAVA